MARQLFISSLENIIAIIVDIFINSFITRSSSSNVQHLINISISGRGLFSLDISISECGLLRFISLLGDIFHRDLSLDLLEADEPLDQSVLGAEVGQELGPLTGAGALGLRSPRVNIWQIQLNSQTFAHILQLRLFASPMA